MSDQLLDQAREHIARVWTEQGWRSEQALDGTGWDVWTLDATGQRRIIIARGCTPNVAGLLCFVSTALPQLCDRATAAELTLSTLRRQAEGMAGVLERIQTLDWHWKGSGSNERGVGRYGSMASEALLAFRASSTGEG